MATRRQQQKAETARRLFVTALRLFREKGYDQTTIDEITRETGVAKGTFFIHFASKDALLDHIGDVQLERIGQSMMADPEFAQRPVREQLHAIVRTLANGLEQQPAEMRMLTLEIIARRSVFDLDPQGLSALDQLFVDILRRGQASGDVPASAPLNRIAMLIRNCYFTAVFEWVRDEQALLVPLAAAYLDLLLHGILTQE